MWPPSRLKLGRPLRRCLPAAESRRPCNLTSSYVAAALLRRDLGHTSYGVASTFNVAETAFIQVGVYGIADRRSGSGAWCLATARCQPPMLNTAACWTRTALTQPLPSLLPSSSSQGIDLYTPNTERLTAALEFQATILLQAATADPPIEPGQTDHDVPHYVCNGQGVIIQQYPTYEVGYNAFVNR